MFRSFMTLTFIKNVVERSSSWEASRYSASWGYPEFCKGWG